MSSKQHRIPVRVAVLNNRLQLVVDDEATGPTPLDPERPLEAILGPVDPDERVILEVRDFVYRGFLYQVAGVTLGPPSDALVVQASSQDASAEPKSYKLYPVVRRWSAADHGLAISYTFGDLGGDGGDATFRVSAASSDPGAPVLVSFAPGQGSGYGGPEDDPGDPQDPGTIQT